MRWGTSSSTKPPSSPAAAAELFPLCAATARILSPARFDRRRKRGLGFGREKRGGGEVSMAAAMAGKGRRRSLRGVGANF